MKPAIFLDRDGVIIENRPNYVRTWSDVEIYPQALRALARLKAGPYQIVLVTNQAGIGHGLIAPETAAEINQRLLAEIKAHGGKVTGVYVCPHTPSDDCHCRKPSPGLILQAAQELDLDLSRSILIGDAYSDLLAGRAAGVSRLALVRTGRGAQQELAHRPPGLGQFTIYDTLLDALLDLAHEIPA